MRRIRVLVLALAFVLPSVAARAADSAMDPNGLTAATIEPWLGGLARAFMTFLGI